MSHTPTPWLIDPATEDEGGCLITASTSKRWPVAWHVSEANAAFIVSAVNSHDEMLAALKSARTRLMGTGIHRQGEAHNKEDGLREIDAAIAKAEAQP
jgi:hypothetical protein